MTKRAAWVILAVVIWPRRGSSRPSACWVREDPRPSSPRTLAVAGGNGTVCLWHVP
jgi:hypothetical protein